MKLRKAFTLIEILLVVAILSVLAVTVFVALNPSQRLKDAKDVRRQTDVDTILSAIHQCIIDNKGSLTTCGLSLGLAETQLGTGAAAVCSPLAPVSGVGCSVAASTACLDLSTPLVKYMKSMPIDPTGGTTWTSAKTGYTAAVDANGIVTIKACGTEGSTTITASR